MMINVGTYNLTCTSKGIGFAQKNTPFKSYPKIEYIYIYMCVFYWDIIGIYKLDFFWDIDRGMPKKCRAS
jgi:hypothetical protein